MEWSICFFRAEPMLRREKGEGRGGGRRKGRRRGRGESKWQGTVDDGLMK